MPAMHYGTPGGTLETTGHKYGPAATVGAQFERHVADALDQWLCQRPETVHVFHDLSGLDTSHPETGRRLTLGTTNIDHVVLTGKGWLMLDAKNVTAGTLRFQDGKGLLITPDGQRRPQPWLEDGRSYSRAGSLFDLTAGKRGVMVFVFPDGVDYTDPSLRTAPFLGGREVILISVSELAAGELEELAELPPPYAPAEDRDVARLRRYTSHSDAQ